MDKKATNKALEDNIEDFYRTAYLFRVNYITNYIMAIKTNAIDLYDKETLNDHAHRKLIIIAGNIERVIANVIGYEDFINKDLLYLDVTCNLDALLYKTISRDAILKIQQNLRDRRELIYNNIDNPTQKAQELQKLYDKVQMHELLFLLVEQYLKEDVTKTLETTLNNNLDFYKERHDLYTQADALIVDIERLISERDAHIQSNSKIDAYKKRRPKSPSAKIPNIQRIDLDLTKFFNSEYIINQPKKIDENAHKKDLTIDATLIYDKNDLEDLEDVRFSTMILRDKDTKKESVQLYALHYALLSGFIDIRDENKNIDKSIKLQDVLRYITDDMSYKLPTNKKSLQYYEDLLLFAKKFKATFTITETETGEELFRLLDPIPLLENYKAFSERTGEYEYIVGNSFITAFKTKMEEIYGTQKADKKANLTSKTRDKALFKDGQRNDPPIINAKYYIYPKIMQMINAVNKNKVTNGIINIEPIYKHYATYRGHTAPTKDDKQDARTCINKFLDHLIGKGLVKSYEPLKDKKTGEILQYKISVCSDRDIRDNKKKTLKN